MAGQFDQAKGRAKEAAGDLTGDDELKAEGQTDRAGGEIKEKVEGFIDKVKDKVHDLTDRK